MIIFKFFSITTFLPLYLYLYDEFAYMTGLFGNAKLVPGQIACQYIIKAATVLKRIKALRDQSEAKV